MWKYFFRCDRRFSFGWFSARENIVTSICLCSSRSRNGWNVILFSSEESKRCRTFFCWCSNSQNNVKFWCRFSCVSSRTIYSLLFFYFQCRECGCQRFTVICRTMLSMQDQSERLILTQSSQRFRCNLFFGIYLSFLHQARYARAI